METEYLIVGQVAPRFPFDFAQCIAGQAVSSFAT